MITATFKVNGQDFRVMLNNNEELSANNSGLTDAQRTLIQSLPRAEGSTISQYKVKVDDLVVNGNSRANGLLKLAASMIQDANMKAAVRASHHSGTAVNTTAQTTLDALCGALKNASLDWLKEAPKEVLEFVPGLAERVKKLEALEALGLTDEQKKAMIALL